MNDRPNMNGPQNPGFIITNNEEVRMVMVGKTGSGKSAAGNTILGRRCFESRFGANSLTVDSEKGKGMVDGQKVAVIDTPGLFDTRFGYDKTSKDICQCISFASPGPHVFLVVVRLGRYTDEEKQTVQKIQMIFGQAADRYSMVLFTGGDLLEDTIEKFLADSPDLQQLVDRCNGRYHVFNNKTKDRSQITKLLQKIRCMVEENGGNHYTNEMFQEAERAIEEEKQRILKEKEEKIQKEREELERKIQEKYEKEMNKIQEQIMKEREKEKKEREEEMMVMNQERQKERAEREEERKKDREDKERQMENMMQQMREQHHRELEEQKKLLFARHAGEARDTAESSNPFYSLITIGEAVVEGVRKVGRAIRKWFR